MRAREFISEVVALGAPPATNWSMDTDSADNEPIRVGSWKDPTGNNVRSMFKPSPDGKSAELYFDRQNSRGNPSMKITGTGGNQSSYILTGAVNNIKTYLDQNPQIQSVSFNSVEPTRSTIYARMIDRIAPQQGLVGKAIVADDAGYTNFVLSRAKNGETHQPISQSVRAQMPTRPPTPPPYVPTTPEEKARFVARFGSRPDRTSRAPVAPAPVAPAPVAPAPQPVAQPSNTSTVSKSASALKRLGRLGGADDVNTFGYGSPAIDQQYIDNLEKEIAKNPADPYNKTFQDEIKMVRKQMDAKWGSQPRL